MLGAGARAHLGARAGAGVHSRGHLGAGGGAGVHSGARLGAGARGPGVSFVCHSQSRENSNPGGWVFWQPGSWRARRRPQQQLEQEYDDDESYDAPPSGEDNFSGNHNNDKLIETTEPFAFLAGPGASAGHIVLYDEDEKKPPLVVFSPTPTTNLPALPPPRATNQQEEQPTNTSAWGEYTPPPPPDGQPSPRRSLRISFTCNRCGTRTTALVNPTAWRKGTLICACDGCDAMHTLVDHLGVLGFEQKDFEAAREADPQLGEDEGDELVRMLRERIHELSVDLPSDDYEADDA